MRLICGLLLAALVPAIASGQSAITPRIGLQPPVAPEVVVRDAQGNPTIRAIRLTTPLTLDGRLDEPIYAATKSIGDFVQQEPFEGQPATERTEMWMFFDDNAVYVSARLWESSPDKRVMSDMQRDSRNLFNNDHFAVMLDTFNDGRNGYYFYANAQGGMHDGQLVNESPNTNWNGVWDVRAADFDGGWTIEFRIPFRSLRYKQDGDTWGINFRRVVRWKNESSFLAPVPQSWGRRGLMKVSSAGTVVGLTTPTTALSMDIKPYLLGTSLTNRTASPSVNNSLDGAFGGDLKWGITQSLVADVTYNTDFAQVEDDEAQVNLTRFSVFFPEKREFFLEGQDYFNFAGASSTFGGSGFGPSNTPILFYSRRIGIKGGVPVPIRAGGRLLGRGAGFQLGVLHVRTAETPEASAQATDFSVVRLNRNIFSRSRIGVIGTRRAEAHGSVRPNYAYGSDFLLVPSDNTELSGYWARTETPGVSGATTSYRARFDHNADAKGLELEHLFVGQNFNPEAGFVRRTAFRRSYAKGRLSPRPAHLGPVRKLFFEASGDYYANPAGQRESSAVTGSVRIEMKNTDRVSIETTDSFERLDSALGLGNGVTIPAGAYRFRQVRFFYEMSPSRPISGFLSGSHGEFYGGTLDQVAWNGRVELASRFYVEPTVSRSWVRGPFGRGTSDLFGSRLTFTLTPRMFVGALVQYRSNTNSLSTNVRFRWEYQPGSEMFLVYSDGRTTADHRFPPTLENRSIVFKITRLVRW